MGVTKEVMLQNADRINFQSSLSIEKQCFLSNMIKTMGNVTQSCQLTGISRTTYYRWLTEDEVFQQALASDVYEEIKLDFVESKLMKRIEQGSDKLIQFYLETKGKKRGYVVKEEPNKKLDPNRKPSWFDDDKANKAFAIENAEIVEDKPLPKSVTHAKQLQPKPNENGQPNQPRRRTNLSTQNILELRKSKDQAGSQPDGNGGS